MRSHRCRRADSLSSLCDFLGARSLEQLSTAARGLILALGLAGTGPNVIGSEAKTTAAQAAAESELGFGHRIGDENQPTPSREAATPAASVSQVAATPSATPSIEGALHRRHTLFPETPQPDALTNMDSSVSDLKAGEHRFPLIKSIEVAAASMRLKRERFLFVHNYPFVEGERATSALFAENAATDLAGVEFLRRTTFERHPGLRTTLMPELLNLISTPAIPRTSSSLNAAGFSTAHPTASVSKQRSDVLRRKPIASREVEVEKRDWATPSRAASAYPTGTRRVATPPERSAGGNTPAAPVGFLAASSYELLASHLTFGTNGARLSGNGTIIGNVVLDANLGIGPGNSPGLLTVTGNLTWSEGGFFELEIQDPTGEPGTGWDAVHVNGNLQFPATLGEPLTLHLRSLTASGAGGNISNFLSSRPYALQVLTATGGINGFNPAAVRITTTGFTNTLDGGSFALLASGDNLMLTFTPVPEPSTWALMLTGASVLAVKFIRRRRRV